MGLFSFITDAGRKISELPESGAHAAAQSKEKGETENPDPNPIAADKLMKILTEYHLEVEELSLQVVNQSIRISGKVETQEIKEKVILALGNIQGIAEVNEDLSVDTEAPEAFFHTVQPADTLALIAEKVFEKQGKEQLILDANTPFLKSEKDISPGMVLRIPSQERREE